MSYIEDTFRRNRVLINKLLCDLEIKKEYDYDFLSAENIQSIFVSKEEKEKEGLLVSGRHRLIVKYKDNDGTVKRTAIKNFVLPEDNEGFLMGLQTTTRMAMLSQLFSQQKHLEKFAEYERGLKLNNSQLEDSYEELFRSEGELFWD